MIIGAIAFLNSFNPASPVSDVAHLGGMLFGYVFLKASAHARRRSDRRAARVLPDLETGARQEKVSGVHAQERLRTATAASTSSRSTPARHRCLQPSRGFLRHNLGMKAIRVLVAMFLGVLGLTVFLANTGRPTGSQLRFEHHRRASAQARRQRQRARRRAGSSPRSLRSSASPRTPSPGRRPHLPLRRHHGDRGHRRAR